jgi:hypothetical protein
MSKGAGSKAVDVIDFYADPAARQLYTSVRR